MSMHADEESDEGIVPMKRSNNGGSPLAEIVEGRASPEGNGGQATAVRTPSRVSRRADWTPCAKRRDRARECGSPRCCITSPSIF
jgi:hypothetical protein